MTDNIIEFKICPDDGKLCVMKDEDKDNRGCWLCPKIQKLREGGKNDGKEKVSRTR